MKIIEYSSMSISLISLISIEKLSFSISINIGSYPALIIDTKTLSQVKLVTKTLFFYNYLNFLRKNKREDLALRKKNSSFELNFF